MKFALLALLLCSPLHAQVMRQNGINQSNASITFSSITVTNTATTRILSVTGDATIDGNLGINDATPDGQLEVKSNKAPAAFIVAISSQNDTTGNIMAILGTGHVGIGNVAAPAKLTVHRTAIDTVSRANATAYIGDTTLDAGLAMQQQLSSPYAFRLQNMDSGGSTLPLALNPSGGNTVIGSSLTIGNIQPQDSTALCMKNGTLGHCTSAVGADGTCTCLAP